MVVILALAGINGNAFNSQTKEGKINTPFSEPPSQILDVIRTLYQDCLGFGNGLYLIVKCPTENGHTYQEIFTIPYDLAAKFSKKIFTIRDLSINETFDGSIILQYQKNLYKTTHYEK